MSLSQDPGTSHSNKVHVLELNLLTAAIRPSVQLFIVTIFHMREGGHYFLAPVAMHLKIVKFGGNWSLDNERQVKKVYKHSFMCRPKNCLLLVLSSDFIYMYTPVFLCCLLTPAW